MRDSAKSISPSHYFKLEIASRIRDRYAMLGKGSFPARCCFHFQHLFILTTQYKVNAWLLVRA